MSPKFSASKDEESNLIQWACECSMLCPGVPHWPGTVGSDTGRRMFIIGSVTTGIPDNGMPSPTLVWLKYRGPHTEAGGSLEKRDLALPTDCRHTRMDA